MLKNGKFLFSIIFLIAVFYGGLFILSDQYCQYREDIEYKKFILGNSFYTPIKNNLPWEINVVYNEINNLSPQNNLILVGASTTREGVIPENINLPQNWTLHNFAIGADTVYSFTVMKNYLNQYGSHKPDKSDTVVLHIFYATFVETPPENDYLRQIIEKTGTYHVDNFGNINGTMVYPQKVWELKNYQIGWTVNEITGIQKDDLAKSLLLKLKPIVIKTSLGKNMILENQNMTTDEKIVGYKAHWSQYSHNITYPGNSTQKFKELIIQLKNQTNVVVVNMYVPSWQRDLPKEQQYELWMRSDLIPFLENQNISFLDYSTNIPDDEYGDSAHLFKKGREHYSLLFNNDINLILTSLNNITTAEY